MPPVNTLTNVIPADTLTIVYAFNVLVMIVVGFFLWRLLRIKNDVISTLKAQREEWEALLDAMRKRVMDANEDQDRIKQKYDDKIETLKKDLKDKKDALKNHDETVEQLKFQAKMLSLESDIFLNMLTLSHEISTMQTSEQAIALVNYSGLSDVAKNTLLAYVDRLESLGKFKRDASVSGFAGALNLLSDRLIETALQVDTRKDKCANP